MSLNPINMATKTTPTDNTIMAIWGKSDAERKSEDLQLNFKMLQAKGNEDLITKQIAVNTATKALETAKMEAMKSANFTAIASAALKAEAATLEFNRAKGTFISLFGIEPSI